MFMLSQHALTIICATKRGYWINCRGDVQSPQGNILKTTANKDGYRKFTIRIDGKHSTIFVHKMMAYSKYGEAALATGVEVRHLNGNKVDNTWNNIEIGTRSDNMMDRPVEQRQAVGRKMNANRRKLTQQQAETIRAEKTLGASYKYLAKKYSVSPRAIWNIIKDKTYKEGTVEATNRF
jgi:hypothetical protein